MVDFVGADMRREVGEEYFTNACFLFEGLNSAQMTRFCVTDQWNLGFQPIKYVTRVEVRVHCEEFCQADNRNPWDWYPEGPNSTGRVERLFRDLTSLFQFKSGTKFTIQFSRPSPMASMVLDSQESICKNVVSVAFPFLQCLIFSGHKIRVGFEEELRDGECKKRFTSSWNFLTMGKLIEEFRLVSSSKSFCKGRIGVLIKLV